MSKETAKAMLILYYGIKNPTDKQIARYILYGRAE